ncbi:MAG: UDP-N-acetylmuramoyl-tripeptide--D-alanyl-D-alanine ligase [Magnetococcales bacterium]|nr:UDP-N-acetylmuramoyl-tripeptide--D-alanyl-D-alanine ligase [Magnetococcales bacterium]
MIPSNDVISKVSSTGMTLNFISSTLGAAWQLPEGVDSQQTIAGVSIDSRTLEPGALFAAITGPRFDGHDYIDKALEKGCAALLVNREINPAPPVPVLSVPDTLTALTRLAAAWRKRVNPKVIAITGSSGKTTVKEMTTGCLKNQFRVHATRGNFNNHIGLPLTILAMPEKCQVLVVEMGMSAGGEIAHLAAIAKPDIGVITNIQAAHLAQFNHLGEIAAAKGELMEALPPVGVGILPRDGLFTPLLRKLASPAEVITFGGSRAQGARDLEYGSFRYTPNGIHFRIPDSGDERNVEIKHTGEHTALNALAALAAAREVGAEVGDIVAGLADFQPPAGRGNLQTTSQGVTLIDDTYNANPGSVAAALESLGKMDGAGRRVAILGDMLELGSEERALHAGLIEAVIGGRVDLLLSAGPLMKALHEAVAGEMRLESQHRDKAEGWLGEVAPLLKPGDVVLVKGSRGMAMERIVQDLLGQD